MKSVISGRAGLSGQVVLTARAQKAEALFRVNASKLNAGQSIAIFPHERPGKRSRTRRYRNQAQRRKKTLAPCLQIGARKP